ncbi:MAG: LytR/AlgR family response regulator transcription factor [Burkholderiales bacterium]
MKAPAPRILVADDEPALAQYLGARLAQLWPGAALLPLARNGLEALAAIREHEPDAAFLDIRMPGLTGLELAARIETPTHVVFVTAYDQYAVEAFDRNAVDYLVKPVSDERLARAIERLKAKIAARETPPDLAAVLARIAASLPGAAGGYLRWVRALKGEEVRQIAVDEVFYFQARDKYTSVVTAEGEFLIRLALSELARQLDPAGFSQVHRSTLVNMRFVQSTRRDLGGRVFIRLKDAGRTELAVSRAFAHHFRQM